MTGLYTTNTTLINYKQQFNGIKRFNQIRATALSQMWWAEDENIWFYTYSIFLN